MEILKESDVTVCFLQSENKTNEPNGSEQENYRQTHRLHKNVSHL